MSEIEIKVGGEDILKQLKSIIGGVGEDKKVVKTLPMRKTWLKLWHEVDKATDDVIQAERKRRSLHRRFWSQVEQDTGDYSQMQYDDKKQEIKVFKS